MSATFRLDEAMEFLQRINGCQFTNCTARL